MLKSIYDVVDHVTAELRPPPPCSGGVGHFWYRTPTGVLQCDNCPCRIGRTHPSYPLLDANRG